MKPEIFAEWLHRQGYKVFNTDSSYWFEVVPQTFQAFPYHWVIQPAEKELAGLLKEHKGYSLRYSAPLSHHSGAVSYHVVYQNESCKLSDLSKNARYDVRKGRDYGQVKQISLERLAEEGWELQSDTLLRQDREDAQDQAVWEKLCLSAIGLEGFEAWGAIHDGVLVASALCFIMDETCSILYQQSRTEHLSNNINNVLAYEITHNMINRPDIHQVFYGLHSLDAPPSVDAFKFRMGFEAKPVRQRIFIRPPLSAFINQTSHSVVTTAQKIFPHSPLLGKAEGMIRFYLEGKKPLDEQEWPENLLDKKEDILKSLQ